MVKSLRLEHFNPVTGHSWTQKDLAQAANLSEDIVSKIERGKRVTLDSDVLLSLGQAFNLTPAEQWAFFSAATDVDDPRLPPDTTCIQSILEHLWSNLTRIRQPTYLFDSCYDLIGLNASLMAFYGLVEGDVDKNMLQILFAPQSPQTFCLFG